MRLAVTGASGFVGGAVCRAAVAGGLSVEAFGRRPCVDPAHVGGARYHGWDLLTAPLPEIAPVDAVVHCAGAVSDGAPPAQYWAVNLAGTRAVLDAFRPPTRIVHLSTARVYDPFRPTVAAVEDEAPVARYDHPYSASKAAAERALLAAMARAEDRRDAVILRPAAVYGPGERSLPPDVVRAVRGTTLWAVGDGRQRLHLTGIGNLVDACLLAATGPLSRGVFNVADAEPLALDALLRALLAARGSDAVVRYLPVGMALPLAAVAEGAAKLARRSASPHFTRHAVRHLAVERSLDLSNTCERLGYDPAPTAFAAVDA